METKFCVDTEWNENEVKIQNIYNVIYKVIRFITCNLY